MPAFREHKEQCEEHLSGLGITKELHRRISTEGALLGSVFEHGLSPDLAIVSDDAGKFNVLIHALWWVHAQQPARKRIPLNEQHRQVITRVHEQIWNLYANLKTYELQATACGQGGSAKPIRRHRYSVDTLCNAEPDPQANPAQQIRIAFRAWASRRTAVYQRRRKRYPRLREKRKVSGDTRSNTGRRCRDTFASFKKTCRKLGISFWDYLTDRVCGRNQIHPLPGLVSQRLAET
jgi:hypothetical protein